MRRLLLVSLLVAIASIILYREPLLEIAYDTAKRFSSHLSSPVDVPETPASSLNRVPIPETPPAANMSVSRAIRKVILALEQSEVVGAQVRRSIGTPALRNLSPFLMLDHFSVKPGAGFPDQYVVSRIPFDVP